MQSVHSLDLAQQYGCFVNARDTSTGNEASHLIYTVVCILLQYDNTQVYVSPAVKGRRVRVGLKWPIVLPNFKTMVILVPEYKVYLDGLIFFCEQNFVPQDPTLW